MTKVPALGQAQDFVSEAEKLNPGEWIDHSMVVAEAARAIAAKHKNLDSETAYVLGMLHDIGRRVGRVGMRHIVEGYKFLTAQGFHDAARICLTHSFPCKEVRLDFTKWDCPEADCMLVRRFLDEIEYNDYDRLLQLCDFIALTVGPCLLEKRMVSAVLRSNGNWAADQMIMKWTATFAIQREFEESIGSSIYSLLPGVIENTFGFVP